MHFIIIRVDHLFVIGRFALHDNCKRGTPTSLYVVYISWIIGYT